MLGEKHDLVHELPEYKERIHELKMNNHHFSKLFNERPLHESSQSQL